MKLYFNFIMLLVLLPIQAGAWDLSIDGTIAAYHTKATTAAGTKYNDFTPGVGGEIKQSNGNWRYGIMGINYYNSIRHDSTLVAGVGEYCQGKETFACVGACAGGVTGYTKAVTPIAAPIVEMGYGRTSVELTTFPTTGFHAEVFTGIVKYKVLTF